MGPVRRSVKAKQGGRKQRSTERQVFSVMADTEIVIDTFESKITK